MNAVSNASAQFAEANRLIRQMLPVSLRKGLISSSAADSWSAIESDADLGTIATHVVGLAGRADAIVLFSRALLAAA